MQASFLTKPQQIAISEIDKPVIAPDQVLVKISHTGLCGSDLHYYQHGRLGDNVIKEPHILGHEASGIIVETGSDTGNFKTGDRVAIEPGLPCFTCEHCRTGNYNLCEQVVFMSVPGHHGSLREFISYSRYGIFKLPENVSLKEAALIEPLAVGYNAAVTAEINPGASVCIIGAGPIGLSVLETIRIMGASTIMITDTNDYRLNIASEHGAEKAVNVLNTNPVEAGLKFTSTRGFDCVIDATGIPAAMESCIELARKGGQVIFVGLGEESMRLSGYRMVKKQLTIKSVYRYANHFQPVINLFQAGKYNLENYISHEYSFSNVEEAFSFACNPKENKMKVMINF